jgi:hypothetical protein
MAVPLGARVKVFGYSSPVLGGAPGQTHVGVVAAVRGTSREFLNVRIVFDDDREIYTRAFAPATVLERTAK